MAKDSRETIKTLTDREHILLRPGMYISSVSPTETVEWIYNSSTGKFSQEKFTYTPGLFKIIEEALTNAVDEYVKTNGKYSNKISVDIIDNKITVEDNGRGIPVIKDTNNNWIPVMAVCNARTGSNFEDAERKSIGLHGIGIKATNIFSEFKSISL